MIAYHVTEREKLPLILKYGLLPQLHYSTYASDHDLLRLYLTPSLSDAKEVAEWEDFLSPMVLKVMVPSGLYMYPDDTGYEVYPTARPFYIRRRISPKHILDILEL